MTTLTIEASSVRSDVLDMLEKLVHEIPDGSERDALEMVSANLRAGRDVIIGGADDTVTPSQAAKILGVSRAHLYKVLDSGALPFTVVGKADRRISMADMRAYIAKAEELKRATARKAAQGRKTRALALDEM